MTKELLEEAYQLFQTFDKLSWSAAIDQKPDLYDRYEKLATKALNRYERRFKKIKQNH